jgi:uncharacterized membrane protein YeaQ/YmgE (transglycosylase-associated protein family)
MGIGGIISAIVVGLIIGALGRLVVPGKQDIAIWLTMIVGIVAALIGSAIAGALGLGTVLTIVLQVLLAAGGVYLIANSRSGRSIGR